MLEKYTRKRHFTRTPEPSPQARQGEGPLIFVIQKHAARRLHYDFRLEVKGALKSWAIPNGPSFDPKVKRLAVMVEDHPIEYQNFEGVIPEGEYGAGQVIIWDKGIYSPDEGGRLYFDDRRQAEELVTEGLDKGKISIYLRGDRLKGSWALVKMQRSGNNWLLIKHQDEFAKPGEGIGEENSSVVSGLTIQDLKEGRSPDKLDFLNVAEIPGALPYSFPSSMRPMLASLTKEPFSDPKWLFEPKLDGYRIVAFIHDREVKLVSRNGLIVSQKYPDLVGTLNKQEAREMVLDGEVTAFDENGRSCFQCLQDQWNRKVIGAAGRAYVPHSIVYYIFDILYLNGYDLRKVPLYLRKELLGKILSPSENVRLVEYFENDGVGLYEASIKLGLEGVIAKLKDSLYEDGARSRDWLKVKAIQSGEFIIGGYTRGTGNRANSFGALLLGSYDAEGHLVFVGHVGSGFDDTELADLRRRMDVIRIEKNPFATNLALDDSATWVKPELVAEVKFAERTQEGYLRMPVFKRLREDKIPNEVSLNELSPVRSVDQSKEEEASPSRNPNLEEIVGQLGNMRENFDINMGGFIISLGNLDKPIWPANGTRKPVTKRDLLEYLTRVSPYILPHLKDRPLTLTRYPNGIYGEHFYQKHWAGPLPGFVETFALSESEGTHDYIVCNNLATLLWLGQLANVDLHTWFSRVTPGPIVSGSRKSEKGTPDFFATYPDFIIFDIDPYIYSGSEPANAEPELNLPAFKQTGKVALWLKDILDDLSLSAYIKTSGRTGLHIFVPIVRQFGFREVHSVAKTIAGFLLQNHPQDITIDWSVSARRGKIFLDYNQNVRGKTLASVYSPRPSPQATVSAPLLWSEVGKVYPTDFTILNMPERLAEMGDIWADILNKRSDLSKITGIGI